MCLRLAVNSDLPLPLSDRQQAVQRVHTSLLGLVAIQNPTTKLRRVVQTLPLRILEMKPPLVLPSTHVHANQLSLARWKRRAALDAHCLCVRQLIVRCGLTLGKGTVATSSRY